MLCNVHSMQLLVPFRIFLRGGPWVSVQEPILSFRYCKDLPERMTELAFIGHGGRMANAVQYAHRMRHSRVEWSVRGLFRCGEVVED